MDKGLHSRPVDLAADVEAVIMASVQFEDLFCFVCRGEQKFALPERDDIVIPAVYHQYG